MPVVLDVGGMKRIPLPREIDFDDLEDQIIFFILQKMLPKTFMKSLLSCKRLYQVAMSFRKSIRIHGLPTDDYYGLRFHFYQFKENECQLSLNPAMCSYKMSLNYFLTNGNIAQDLAYFYFPKIEISAELFSNEFGEKAIVIFKTFMDFIATKKFQCAEFISCVPVWKELNMTNRCLEVLKPKRYHCDNKVENSFLSTRCLQIMDYLTVEIYFKLEGLVQFNWCLGTAMKYIKYMEIVYTVRSDQDLNHEFQDFVPWIFIKDAFKLVLFDPTTKNEELHIEMDTVNVDPIDDLKAMVPMRVEHEWFNFSHIEDLYILLIKLSDKKSILVVLFRRHDIVNIKKSLHEQVHWKRISVYSDFVNFLLKYSNWHGENREEELEICKNMMKANRVSFSRIKNEYFENLGA